MPPRRPGGKYRGTITVYKGAETLDKEFQDGRSRMLQKYIKEQEAKKQDAMLGEFAAKFRVERGNKDVQMKVVGFMLGSRTDLLRDVFKLWIDGKHATVKEKIVQKRTKAWRSSCETCGDPECDSCEAHHQLHDVAFRMPFDLARDAALQREEELKALAAEGPRRRVRLPALPAIPKGRLARTASDTILDGRGHNSIWPCRCAECIDPSMLDTTFLDMKNAQKAVHYKTGRRVFLDESTMRFVRLDATRTHTLSPTSLI